MVKPILYGLMGGIIIIAITITVYPENKVLVLAPTLTANAYSPGGFYDYFEGNCDESCLTIPLDYNLTYDYRSSSNALILLGDMGYDLKLDTSPTLNINDYDSLVILHNEYVTQELFDSITNHPNVYYLYPNALYGLVEIENDTMTLISGHGYNGKDNAFDWEHENTRPDEFDNECLNYSWDKVTNGYQLNCYPENAIQTDSTILEFIK